ncbi:MAG: YhgN family NAAT transporter [Buchnera aphidicola (Meitanaphis elongallis)]
MNEMISSTILLILIMDPLGNLPIFMSILKNLEPKRRRIVLLREMIVALLIMLLFLFAGENILTFLNLKTETVSISGGIILFLIAIKMIFPSHHYDNSIPPCINGEPFLVPLAIPLVAGPSLLATLILLSHEYLNKIMYLTGSLLIAWTFTVIILLLSNVFLRLFGSKGVDALERLMGLILIMLSTQMFLDGIKSWFQI